MRSKILLIISAISALIFSPKANFAQAPSLGTCSNFALFTAGGAFSNVGAATIVTGDVGTHVGAFTAFPPGTLVGTIHWLDPASTQAATDVATAYSDLDTPVGSPISVILNGQVLTPGIYFTGSGAAASLNGEIILNGQNDPNSIFIIRIDGALTTSTFSSVTLINKASLCNVYWQINGQFQLGVNSVFRGTILVNGAIILLEGSSLLGRGLSIAGAIELHDNKVNFMPIAAGTITGTSSVCQGQSGVSYSVPAIDNATDYIWTLPIGATITAGTNTNNITVDFNAIATDGNITVDGTNSCGDGTVSADFAVTVNPLPIISLIYHF